GRARLRSCRRRAPVDNGPPGRIHDARRVALVVCRAVLVDRLLSSSLMVYRGRGERSGAGDYSAESLMVLSEVPRSCLATRYSSPSVCQSAGGCGPGRISAISGSTPAGTPSADLGRVAFSA